MAILLVVLSLAFLLSLEWVLRRTLLVEDVALGSVPSCPTPLREPAPKPASDIHPVWVAGYRFCEELHYHRGHAWARDLGEHTVAVGIDDFAAWLLGRPRGLVLPRPGEWVRQGAAAFSIESVGPSARMVSPVDGEVVEINPLLSRDPALAALDPYGRGWLYKVRALQLDDDLRNLLTGSLAWRWLEESRDELQYRLSAGSGTCLQDAGRLVPDFAARLRPEEWEALVHEFFLT